MVILFLAGYAKGYYLCGMDDKATVRQVLNDIYELTNWAYLAKNYFGKSRS